MSRKIAREGIEQSYRDYLKQLENVRIGFKAVFDKQTWQHDFQLRGIKFELDCLKRREKRRSEQRREKRLRKKQRLAEAKRLVAEENESDEE